jgi:hypothetical protein
MPKIIDIPYLKSLLAKKNRLLENYPIVPFLVV